MSLPAVITSSLLSTIKATPHLPPNTWYFIAGAALSTLNRPDEIPKVFKYAIEHDSGTNAAQIPQLQIARRTREALIKSGAIIGLPKAINALFALKEHTPQHLRDEPLGVSPTARSLDLYATPTSQILTRGQNFFNKVYGKVTNRVMGQMDRSGTEDLGILARLEYGYILSPVGVLSPVETSYVILASLIPQDVNPQLKGHLVGALNNGASEDEVKAVRDVIIKICESAGMKRLAPDAIGGWGWREDVANLKIKPKL